MKKIIFHLIFFLPLLYNFALSQNLNQNLSLTISLDKSQFLEGEPIWLTFQIENIGSNPDSLPLLNEGTLIHSVDLIDQNNQKIFEYGDYSTYIRKRYTILRPDEKYTKSIELLQYYGNKFEGDNIFSPETSLLTGSYIIQSNYKDEQVLLLKSNQLSFDIIKSTGHELEALNALRNVFKLNETDIKSKMIAYKDFYKKYNNSVYAELSYSWYSLTGDLGKLKLDEKELDDVVSFIERNPNSYYSIDILWLGKKVIEDSGKGKETVKNFLNEMMNKYPDTKTSTSARKLLNDLNH